MAGSGVAEWDGPEISRCNVAGVGGAEHVFKIHESAGREISTPNAERQWRLLWLFRFLHHGGAYRYCYSAHGCIGHVGCARRLILQLLFQSLDLLLLLGNLFLLLAYRFAQR